MTDAPVRRRTARTLVVVALVVAVLVAGFAGFAGVQNPTGSSSRTAGATPTGQASDAVAKYGDRTQAWAHLIVGSQQLLTAWGDAAKSTVRGTDPAGTAKAVGFVSKTATLAEYRYTGDTLRFCLTTKTGEFYAATVKDPTTRDPRTTMTLGVGECAYDTAPIRATDDGAVTGADLLTLVKIDYDTITRYRDPTIIEATDGTHRALPKTATAAANAVAKDMVARDQRKAPLTLTTRRLAALGVDLPAGIRLGYYTSREADGFDLCLTDGTEEAIFHTSPAGTGVLRHAAGTCTR